MGHIQLRSFKNLRPGLFAQSGLKGILLYAIGEIILVVIGILIAVSINTWNNGRKLAATQAVLLERLSEDVISAAPSQPLRYMTIGLEEAHSVKRPIVLSVGKILSDQSLLHLS